MDTHEDMRTTEVADDPTIAQALLYGREHAMGYIVERTVRAVPIDRPESMPETARCDLPGRGRPTRPLMTLAV